MASLKPERPRRRDWCAGTVFTSFPNSMSGLEHVDVTAAVLAAQGAGEAFLGFRLSTATDSRYLLGPPFTGSGPTMTAEIIPEPSTLALLGLGTLGVLGCGWRRCKQATS